jgi:hypothetical protein
VRLDGRLLTFFDPCINLISNSHNDKKVIRVINEVTINEFIQHLSSEDWELLLSGGDMDSKFSSFLNIFLRIFETSFPTETEKKLFETNVWITKGIKTSCKHKRALYLNSRISNNQHSSVYCMIWCSLQVLDTFPPLSSIQLGSDK